jgi:hypothetical protein
MQEPVADIVNTVHSVIKLDKCAIKETPEIRKFTKKKITAVCVFKCKRAVGEA